MIVMKFGGSSLTNAERIRRVGHIVEAHLEEKPIIILSAMGKTTDDLLEAAQAALAGSPNIRKIRERHLEALKDLNLSADEVETLLEELDDLLKGISIVKELTPRVIDLLLSFGERIAVRLFSAYLCSQGIVARAVDAWDVGLMTSSDYNRAEPLAESYNNIPQRLSAWSHSILPIVTGFIAKEKNGSITTMGRGGSDLTAAVIGAAMNVREIQMWKDVHGIMSTDPRILQTAFPIPAISFEAAAELAYFGAKVLHPQSILPAMKKGIPVRIKNSYDPDHPGTLIGSDVDSKNRLVTAVTYKSGQAMVHICSIRMLGQYGFLAKVFQIFAELHISVDVITTSEVSVSLTLENLERIEELETRLKQIATVRIQREKAILSLIGSTSHSSQILERSLKTLTMNGINVLMISHGASKINTTLVIDEDKVKAAIHLLHEHFFQ